MDREGISKVRRTELLARLTALEKQIADQTSRVRHIEAMGWDVTSSRTRLDTLIESRDLYRSALRHLLGEPGLDEPTPQ